MECTSSDTTDNNNTDTSESAKSTPETTDTTNTTDNTNTEDTNDSKFSELNNPSAVESVLNNYDYNYDDHIEFLDSYSNHPDGQEEFIDWAITAGMDSSDSAVLTHMFMKYDANSDDQWSIYELDKFYDDYYKNN